MQPSLPRNLLLLGELTRVAEALQAASVELLVLKGLPLSVRLTGRLGGRERRIRDNDILVRRRDVRRAVSAIESLGYAPLANMPLESQLPLNFEYELHRPVGDTTSIVEIHWAPFPPLLYPVDEAYLWSRTESIEIAGRRFRVFDRVLTLLHQASHFVQHAASSDAVLKDLALAWNAWAEDIDPADLRTAARRTGLVHVLDFALRAADDRGMLQRRRPEPRSARAAGLRLLLPSNRLGPVQVQPTLRRELALATLAPTRRVPYWLWTRVFPPAQVIAGTQGRALSPRIYLEYALRPLRRLTGRSGPRTKP